MKYEVHIRCLDTFFEYTEVRSAEEVQELLDRSNPVLLEDGVVEFRYKELFSHYSATITPVTKEGERQ